MDIRHHIKINKLMVNNLSRYLIIDSNLDNYSIYR